MGEIHFGNLKKYHHALMVAIGTGIGGCLYLNDKIYYGANYGAGEIGHIIVNNKE